MAKIGQILQPLQNVVNKATDVSQGSTPIDDPADTWALNSERSGNIDIVLTFGVCVWC